MNRRRFLGAAAAVTPVAATALKAAAVASPPLPGERKPDSISYVVPWAERYAEANTALGVGRPTPVEHPLCPGHYCREVRIRGVGKPVRGPHGPAFALARVTVVYGKPEFGPIAAS